MGCDLYILHESGRKQTDIERGLSITASLHDKVDGHLSGDPRAKQQGSSVYIIVYIALYTMTAVYFLPYTFIEPFISPFWYHLILAEWSASLFIDLSSYRSFILFFFLLLLTFHSSTFFHDVLHFLSFSSTCVLLWLSITPVTLATITTLFAPLQ